MSVLRAGGVFGLPAFVQENNESIVARAGRVRRGALLRRAGLPSRNREARRLEMLCVLILSQRRRLTLRRN